MQAALDEVKRAKATELPDNEALAHVATEFLAARMSKEEKPITRLTFLLRQLEKVYGGRLIWIPNDEAANVLMEAMKQRPELFRDPTDPLEEDDDE